MLREFMWAIRHAPYTFSYLVRLIIDRMSAIDGCAGTPKQPNALLFVACEYTEVMNKVMIITANVMSLLSIPIEAIIQQYSLITSAVGYGCKCIIRPGFLSRVF